MAWSLRYNRGMKPDYDQLILQTIRTTWRYKPYEINGTAVPVRTAVTFIYTP